MRGQRSFLIGLVIAGISVIGYAIWQFTLPDSSIHRGGPLPGSEQKPSDRSDNGLFLRKKTSPDDNVDAQRDRMVREQLVARDITDQRVLDAMRKVPRHRFVPADQIRSAHMDGPLPIGHGQTISQPYIVALMTQLAHSRPDSIALDVGTGSGYQAAILAELCQTVFSIEIVKPLAESARDRLAQLEYENVTVRCGDGYRGWPEKAPFDLVIVAAAPDHVPQSLIDQLKPGGHLVIPVGTHFQKLLVIEKLADGSVHRENVAPVMFVPMTGEAMKAHD